MVQIKTELALDFDNVRIEPKRTFLTSRSQVDLNVKYVTEHSNREIKGVPIISANMSAVSTFNMAKALAKHNMFCALHKHYTVEQYDEFFSESPRYVVDHTFFTMGLNDLEKLKSLSVKPDLICMDVANGYMDNFSRFVEKVRDYAPQAVIMAGNVVTAEGVADLALSGADIIKIGIGSGSVCHTRLVAGVGVPQLTAILNTVDEARKRNVLICSDGGIVHPGDFSIAYIAGAHFVMAGGIFSGHDECDMMRITDEQGQTFMQYYGMSSEHAMEKHNGGMAKYRASEGKVVRVKYKGSVENTIEHILGGIRSTGTYINVDSLQRFANSATLIRVASTHNKIFGE